MKYLLMLLVALATVSLARADELAAPDLFKVYLSTAARPITNARVLKVTRNGITFMCDQGMVQAPFANLAPEFAAYYKDKAEKPVELTVPKAVIPIAPPKAAPKEKTAVQKAQEAVDRANQVGNLNAQIANSEALISRYEKQSLIGNKNPISTEAYELAKAKRDDAKAKLAQLGG